MWLFSLYLKSKQLQMNTEANLSLNKIAGSGGCKLVSSMDPVTGFAASSMIVRENSVIDTLTGKDPNGNVVDFVTLFNISGEILGRGDLFIAPTGYFITSIELTSGSVLFYL